SAYLSCPKQIALTRNGDQETALTSPAAASLGDLREGRGNADADQPREVGRLIGRLGALADPRERHQFAQGNRRDDRAPVIEVARQIAIGDEPPVERQGSA